MIKVMTVVGTRPEIIRLSRVLAELDKCARHVLVHTGQNYDYELNEIFFEDLGIRRPDHFLEAAGSSPVDTVGRVMSRAYDVMRDEAPDAVLVLGDTNSCLAAYAAKRLKIPTFHMEAGNRCFDERVPEEINRRVIDHISDVNLPYSNHARELLLREGLPPDLVIVTGSPMNEVLNFYNDAIKSSDVLDRLDLAIGSYFVVSAHREENVESLDGIQRFCEILRSVWEAYQLPVVVSTHPRTAKRMQEAQIAPMTGDIRFLKPFGFPDYVHLQTGAKAVLSDSGTISEESAILGFPAVNLRETHERHEGMEEAVVPMCGFEADSVMAVLDLVISQSRGGSWGGQLPHAYSSPNVSAKVVRIIYSYVPYVLRKVWGRSN